MAIDAGRQPVNSLRIEVPALADRLAEIRRQLVSWLQRVGVSDTSAADIVLVVNEACTNCVEHAYRDIDAGVIRMEARLAAEQIMVDIADSGMWRTPPANPGDRGRGLTIMRAISDDVALKTSSEGTTVHLSFGAVHQGCGSRTT